MTNTSVSRNTGCVILIDTPQNATLGDSKGLDDLCLFAGTLDAELCGEHAKGKTLLPTKLR